MEESQGAASDEEGLCLPGDPLMETPSVSLYWLRGGEGGAILLLGSQRLCFLSRKAGLDTESSRDHRQQLRSQ